jgi:chaperonin GroEL
MQKVGNEGVSPVEEAKTAETELDVSRACSSTAAISRRTSSPTPRRWWPSLRMFTSSSTRRSSPRSSRSCPILEAWSERQAAPHHREDIEGEALATLVVNKLAAA